MTRLGGRRRGWSYSGVPVCVLQKPVMNNPTISIICPSCRAKMKAPAAAIGKRVKCVTCGQPLVIEANPPAPLMEVQSVAEEPFLAELVPSPTYKACPFCGENVLQSARKCKHCGETLDVALRAAEEAKQMARRSDRPNVYMNAGGGSSSERPTTVVVHHSGFNHGPHLILTLFTCGAWVPIWLILWACHK
jgi:predicted amidophosphoribosyltransferase